MNKLTPIIMESEIEEVASKLAIVHNNGESRVHFDIGDGMLTEWFGVVPADLQGQNIDGLEVDLHLLVEDPTEWIEECVALTPARIIGQIERMGSQELFLKTVADYKQKTVGGLALMLETPIEAIDEAVLDLVKVILLLSVPAGTSGSKFDIKVVDKIKELRKIYSGSILIDGAIDKDTKQVVMAAGASEVASNSNYWKGNV